jgi:hypothetical protein
MWVPVVRGVPHLRRSASSSINTQPFRAGLTFGGPALRASMIY